MPRSLPNWAIRPFSAWLLLCCPAIFSLSRSFADGDRFVIPIEDRWTITAGDTTLPIAIGDSWEAVLGADFDGRATYTTTLPLLDREEAQNYLLEIDGAATKASVTINGDKVVEHLGGWTPFRINLAALPPGTQGLDLQIELDELVGHNTQGFLPIVVPHFGGLWKHVRLIQTSGPVYLDDLSLLLSGFSGEDALSLTAAVRSAKEVDVEAYEIGWRFVGPTTAVKTDWNWRALAKPDADTDTSLSFPAAGTDQLVGYVSSKLEPNEIRRWSPKSPFLYEVEIAIRERASKTIIDRIKRKAGIRHFSTDGRQLLVNGERTVIRGVLNWGYAPPRIAPSIDLEEMRAELEFARDRGFNLMKFCLWMPPREYLELADEVGMLTWVEYPTWHPDFSEEKLSDLRGEFTEFFHYDRNHASVILRSLTCETGHSASLDVIRDLYETAHRLIPGAIVEDDSSWIQWHRIHDFYDDHPYGNNHTWLDKLASLDSYIAEREAKPLILGEAIAADTWESSSNLSESAVALADVHRMRSIEQQFAYLSELSKTHGPGVMERLRPDSFHYAMEMRKYQIEAFRYRLPSSGYVVSVLRDFPLASMGLIDRDGNSKWTVDQFRWHHEQQLVLDGGSLQRAVGANTTWAPSVSIVFPTLENREVILQGEWSNAKTGEVHQHILGTATTDDEGIATIALRIPVEPTDEPWQGKLAVHCKVDEQSLWNSWHLWVLPEPVAAFSPKWLIHSSMTPEKLERLGIDVADTKSLAAVGVHAEFHGTILATAWDEELLTAIERGANCVMLPTGEKNSFALRDQWFLRGGPVIGDVLAERIELADAIRDLQSFDLAGRVMFEFPWLDRVTPLVSLWDNHDLDHYRTHGLAWVAQVGRGRLLVSALNHEGQQGVEGPSSAGLFTLRRLTELMETIDEPRGLSLDDRRRLRDELTMEQILLNASPWKFRRGPRAADELDETWLSEPLNSDDVNEDPWQPIAIDRHWDGQGHGDLDGWGFYRVSVPVPEGLRGKELYVSFTGVDDYYDVFVDRQVVGSAGNMETRETAFELRTSHSIPAAASEDGVLEIGVRVFDWQGAGGIFRNVYLGTTPLPTGPALLVTGD